jgi:hypothetical protein
MSDSAIQSKDLPLATSSSLKTARGCMRKYQSEYVPRYGYRPLREEEVLLLREPRAQGPRGVVEHDAGRAAAARSSSRTPSSTWTPALRNALAAVADTPDAFDLAKAQVLLTGYHLRWKDEPFEVLQVESTVPHPAW